MNKASPKQKCCVIDEGLCKTLFVYQDFILSQACSIKLCSCIIVFWATIAHSPCYNYCLSTRLSIKELCKL